MILSKLGRRVAALLLSVLLLSASVLPAFATSTSGQLQEVGWAETVSSFLMASGIYPFESDPETGYEEWSVSSLKALWDEFRDDTTQVAYDIVDLTGNLVKGVIAIASGRWSVLREFATWVVNKYDVQDNQTGIELGSDSVINWPVLPSGSGYPSDGTSDERFAWVSAGVYFDNALVTGQGAYFRGLDVGDTVYTCAVRSATASGAVIADFYSLAPFELVTARTILDSAGNISRNGAVNRYSSASRLVSIDGVSYTVYIYGRLSISLGNDDKPYAGGLPYFTSSENARQAFAELMFKPDFQGITADTTTVSIPAPLPSGTDFGGLAVSGTGVAVTPEQLEEIVQNAVKEALKPSVAVVPVAISPDVSVNPSGEITVSGDVTIDSGNIPLQPSDYSAPNLSKVFPFSIPWDILVILNVLDAEPVRPEFNVDLYIPVLDVHVPWTIGVSEALQEPVDNFMASMRLLLLVAMCAGTLWLFWRSNL